METEQNESSVEKSPYPLVDETGYLACFYCGKHIRHTPEENAVFGEEPYPFDRGHGICLSCGGDPRSTDLGTQLGLIGLVCCAVRFEIVRDNLTPQHQALFDALPDWKKIVGSGFLIKGLLMKRRHKI